MLGVCFSVLFTGVVWHAPAVGEAEPEPKHQLEESTKRLLDRSAQSAEQLPDGRMLLNVNGGHRHVFMARVGANGKVETYCADSAHGAEQWLNQDADRQVPK